MMAAQQFSQCQLGDLLTVENPAWAAIAVNDLQLDSRNIARGDLFLACKGAAQDGRQFIQQAIQAGACAVLAEQGDSWQSNTEIESVPVITVAQLSQQLSEIAGRFYQHPSSALPLIGITGSNGKTSCAHLINQLLAGLGDSCATIGTLGAGVNGELAAGINTTPDALSIQRLLAQWRDQSVDQVAMEVSSHGLVQGRVAALNFELALFTNLSRDHLDYHGSMQAYGAAKAQLFQMPRLRHAVLNADDDYSLQLQNHIANDVNVLRFSLQKSSADIWLDGIRYHNHGVNAQLHSPWGDYAIAIPLLGEFNLSNVVAVISCLGVLGYPLEKIVSLLPSLKTVSGRMDKLPGDSDISVVIDYAHTPDALEKALTALRQHTAGELWCVFGCGGDRDRGKRPQMGAAAQQLADHVVVTSDNPRSEKPGTIIDEIIAALDKPFLIEEDRARAIAAVIANAKAGDTVLLAGKGHEQYQLVGEKRLPFSDYHQARLALAARQAGGAS